MPNELYLAGIREPGEKQSFAVLHPGGKTEIFLENLTVLLLIISSPSCS